METGYGDFSYTAEPQVSKRSPDVAICAINKCEMLMQEVETLCRLLGEKELIISELEKELQRIKGE